MPMIDVSAPAGAFEDAHKLARELVAAAREAMKQREDVAKL